YCLYQRRAGASRTFENGVPFRKIEVMACTGVTGRSISTLLVWMAVISGRLMLRRSDPEAAGAYAHWRFLHQLPILKRT
ncbi:MAG: hypothetical protein KDI68_09685, partial [Gammaproteobacteria bacterium]|nr:hypothetical protein [Gammaproteobacteria bacterium]